MNRPLAILSGCLLAVVSAEEPMARIEGGSYRRPLEKSGQTRQVATFLLDVRHVTNSDYLAFVTSHPEWRRSRVNRLFADGSYLGSSPPGEALGWTPTHAGSLRLSVVDDRGREDAREIEVGQAQ